MYVKDYEEIVDYDTDGLQGHKLGQVWTGSIDKQLYADVITVTDHCCVVYKG